MKYIAVCKDMYGNVFEKTFNSEQERTDYIMLSPVQVLFTKDEREVEYEPTSYSCKACKNATDEEIKRLREALAFYAELDGNGIQLYGDMDSKALEFIDGASFPFGQTARNALKGGKE